MLNPSPQKMQQIVLVNHGEVQTRNCDRHPLSIRDRRLTLNGVTQVESAARLLASMPFSAIVHSGLSASAQTADLICAGLNLPVYVDERLCDICPGEHDFVDDEERRSAMEQAYRNAARPDERCLQGESWLRFSLRVEGAWAALSRRTDNQCLLVSAHDSINRMLLAQLCGTGLNSLQHYGQQPGCINILQRSITEAAGDIGAWQIVAMNLVAHEIPGFDLDPDEWLAYDAA